MISAIVTDIEGTTSSLSFVKDVLFPYARKHISSFVSENDSDSAVAQLLDVVRARIAAATGRPVVDVSLPDTIRSLEKWIDEDQKITELKALQGLVWEDGYRRGEFTGHIYADAVDALRRWHAQGIRLYVYSSGSIYAQKLLFAHTEYGDLTPLFDGYFDTTTGPKQKPASYSAILSELALPGDQVLFLSDIQAELDAARQAGMQTGWLMRDAPLRPDAEHHQVSDFGALTV